MKWISFLVTGPEKQLQAFQLDAMFHVELFDRRGQTVRCRAFGDDGGQSAFEEAVELAKKNDVTVQNLVTTNEVVSQKTKKLGRRASVTITENREEYPIVHLASHGMKWGK